MTARSVRPRAAVPRKRKRLVKPSLLNRKPVLLRGDCLELVKDLPDNYFDAIVTDPPYGLSFMGKHWDTHGVPGVHFWEEFLRVLKPGGHLAAFGGSRTYHRMACAIEDGGFEIRDSLMWLYGSGFPKGYDVAKGVDKILGVEGCKGAIAGKSGSVRNSMAGDFAGGEYHEYLPGSDAARQWEGWNTTLKPAFEPIVLARKPLSESTVAANVLRWRTGALNIDACRIELSKGETPYSHPNGRGGEGRHGRDSLLSNLDVPLQGNNKGRWPANVCHDGSDEVVAGFPRAKGAASTGRKGKPQATVYGDRGAQSQAASYADDGSAARFFYCSKASKEDRADSKHPTVKPVKLIRWVTKLVTPPRGRILDPFAGSGTTGAAAFAEGFNCYLMELEESYQADILRRISKLERPKRGIFD